MNSKSSAGVVRWLYESVNGDDPVIFMLNGSEKGPHGATWEWHGQYGTHTQT